MIESVHINNYKGIKNFKLDKLNRINIFIGKNNSGKTSLLEAVYIGIKDNYLSLMLILDYRNLILDNKNIKTLFYNLDNTNKINIILNQNKENIKTEITVKIEESFKISSDTKILDSETFNNEKKYILKQTLKDRINNLTYNLNSSNEESGLKVDVRNPHTDNEEKINPTLSN